MKRRRQRRRTNGVTLVEVMVVMAIMSLVAAAAGFALLPKLIEAQNTDTKRRARTIQQAAVAFMIETPNECPDVEDLLQREILDKTTDHRDSWGQPFTIECEGNNIHVRSIGRDGQAGTDDDLGV